MNLSQFAMTNITQYIFSLTIWQFLYHSIGCYYLVLVIKFLYFTVWNLVKECIPLNDILKKYISKQNNGKQCWAVITGATDGIGLGFAQVLVQLGFDVCLISRNQEKLNKTVENLKQYRTEEHKNRKIMTIQFDYQDSANETKFNQMIEKLKKLDIGILVNNVGTSDMKHFEDFTDNEIKKIINVNVTSMSVMTAALLKQLKSRNGKSAIINLSSFAGQISVPNVSLYAATKSMNTFFSEALSLENPEIDILSVRPMFVESPLSMEKKGFNIPDRRQCAMACLKQLRWEYETNGYILHRILGKFHNLFVPTFIHQKFAQIMTNNRMQRFREECGHRI